MRLCLHCEHAFTGDGWTCPACGFEPAREDGFLCFAPGLAHAGADYDPGRYRLLVELEDGSFWFGARNRLILWALARRFSSARRLMEIGVGTGFVMRAIRRQLPEAALAGSDIHVAGLRFAAERLGASVDLMQLDARRLPFRGEFDAICMFDTLEHIAGDGAVLRQARAALRPGGGILLTVPQHMGLWGPADDIAHHQRRYAIGELRRKTEAAGFRVVLETSFVSLLLPVLWVARLRTRRSGEYDLEREHRVPPMVNRLLGGVMALEFAAIRAGLRFPAGGSLLLAAVRD